MARLLRAQPCKPRIGTGRSWVLSVKPTVVYAPSSYTVDVAMTLTPSVTGVVNTGGYVVTSGSLPTGLSINADSGVISGTPTVIESQSVTVTATNPYGTSVPAFTLNIVAAGTSGGASAFQSSAFQQSAFQPSAFGGSAFG